LYELDAEKTAFGVVVAVAERDGFAILLAVLSVPLQCLLMHGG
jgi:hypothetical protein